MKKQNTNIGKSKTGSHIVTFTVVLLAVCTLSSELLAQQGEPSIDELAPPPLKMFSAEERQQLEASTNIKKRTQLSLDLMEARILKSEKLASESAYKDSLRELAGFQALVENSLDYLHKTDAGGKKADGSFKKFEMYLRKQVSRLEIIRRAMPFKYGYYVQKMMKAVREARAKAIEPLFGDSVVAEETPQVKAQN